MESGMDAYRVLQVDPSAEACVIQAAYRALARRFHPDGDAPDPRRMAELNAAYAVLRDPERRRAFDARLQILRSRPVPIVDGPRRMDAWTPRRTSSVDTPVLDFGRYAGWTVRDLARHDPDYLRWLARHSSGLRYRDAIARVLPREPDLQRRSNSVA